jgi:hypothetical protein
VARSIVVAFRMPPAGMGPGPEGGYLARARALCLRGEALRGRLVAWSASMLAMGWDIDSIRETVLFAASIREEALSVERAWASGMAEGELEPLAPDGQGILAWGEALRSAVALAELAEPGELLVDGDLRALRAGRLTVLDERVAVGGGRRGWPLDLEHPWKRTPRPSEGTSEVPDTIDRAVVLSTGDDSKHRESVATIPEVDLSGTAGDPARPSPLDSRGDDPLTARIRTLALGAASNAAAVDGVGELRRARARVEGGPPSARCQASLALAVMLSIGGRPEEALLEALDALARARESSDPKAIGACMALLAKLYAGAGFPDAATALRDSVAAP